MVYQQHASAPLSVFAQWNPVASRFTVLSRDTNAEAKTYITHSGKRVTG